MLTSGKSPICRGRSFSFGFSDIVSQSTLSVSEPSGGYSEEERVEVRQRQPLNFGPGPVHLVGSFISVGASRERAGMHHTVLFSKRPIENVFTIGEDYKVTGYLSYSYLYSGTTCVGLVFHTESSRTVVRNHKLVVAASQTSRNYSPYFNLEKMGVILFLAEDSSVLAIPTEVASALLVRVE